MIPPSWYVAGAASVGLVVMTNLYLGARDDLARQTEECNTDKITAIAEAEKVTREALAAAHRDALAQLARQAEAADRAREIAEEVAREAAARPVEVREVIREVYDEDQCLGAPVPGAILDSLRGD
jgi:hypothetical protein